MNLLVMGAMMALMMLFFHGRGHHGPTPEPEPPPASAAPAEPAARPVPPEALSEPAKEPPQGSGSAAALPESDRP